MPKIKVEDVKMSVINSTEFRGIMAEADGSVLGLLGNGQP